MPPHKPSNQTLQPTAPPGYEFMSILTSLLFTAAKRRYRSGG
jgi:hypothetical protein